MKVLVIGSSGHLGRLGFRVLRDVGPVPEGVWRGVWGVLIAVILGPAPKRVPWNMERENVRGWFDAGVKQSV